MAWEILYKDSATSTQDIARQNARHGLVVQAGIQTDGRGRHGREWTSPIGNLYLSLVIKPAGGPDTYGAYSFRASLALYRAIDSHDLMLKWPNDVLYQGRKCAGVLLEAHEGNLIIGLGVNIVSAPDGAACIPSTTTDALRDRFLSKFDKLLNVPFDALCTEWLECAHPIGSQLTVKPYGQILQGIFAGLDHRGNLQLDVDGEIHRLSSADVFLGGEPDAPCD